MTNAKSALIGFILLTIAQSIFGQANKIDFGIEGAPSLNFLQGNLIIKEYNKVKIGFSGGLFLQFNFKKFLSLRTSIAYERKGRFIEMPIDAQADPIRIATLDQNLNYLTIPVLVRVSLGKKTRFIFNVGPYFGYLINGTYIGKIDEITQTSGDNTSYYKRIDTGLSTGLGCSVPITKKFTLALEVRNNLGLYNISADPYYKDGTITTNSTSLLLCFVFKLGQRTTDTNGI